VANGFNPAYTKFYPSGWKDYPPDPSTPITAAALESMATAIYELKRDDSHAVITAPAFTGDGTIAGDWTARLAAATQVKLGAVGAASEAGISMGSAGDARIFRSAADTLKSDDGIWAQGGFVHKVKAGTPTDADLVAGMQQSGAMIIDTTAFKIWVRFGATWKQTPALT
jgi:hypothetical protein